MELKSISRLEWIVFFALVAIGIAGRWVFENVPNFSPTVGVAVFAGLYFNRLSIAFLAPLVVMIASNIWLDPYTNWGMLAFIYGAMAFPVLLSRGLSTRQTEPSARRQLRPLGMLACAVLPSVIFFAASNFAFWLWSGAYALDLMGLSRCFVNAIPFYKVSLCSNVIFVAAGLLAYELIGLLFRERQSVAIEP
jgi:hypothetical protein